MSRTSAQYRATEGLNRVGTAIKSATASFSSTQSTGNIADGQVVEVSHPGGTTPTVTALTGKSSYTGAILIDHDTDGASPPTGSGAGEYMWTLRQNAAGDNLYVWGDSTSDATTMKFWVF
jgi:hypothetical protein